MANYSCKMFSFTTYKLTRVHPLQADRQTTTDDKLTTMLIVRLLYPVYTIEQTLRLPLWPPFRGGSVWARCRPSDRRPLATVTCRSSESSPTSPAQQSAATPRDLIPGSSSQASVCNWSTMPLGLGTDWGADSSPRPGMREKKGKRESKRRAGLMEPRPWLKCGPGLSPQLITYYIGLGLPITTHQPS